jgi:hypothetical protein
MRKITEVTMCRERVDEPGLNRAREEREAKSQKC